MLRLSLTSTPACGPMTRARVLHCDGRCATARSVLTPSTTSSPAAGWHAQLGQLRRRCRALPKLAQGRRLVEELRLDAADDPHRRRRTGREGAGARRGATAGLGAVVVGGVTPGR
ncbi:hypothetical protein HBB16_11365 [Pseudonocardia sp. MCCB 268]|nr:hypothetical protein [Pseudonocardia cytotoxica]